MDTHLGSWWWAGPAHAAPPQLNEIESFSVEIHKDIKSQVASEPEILFLSEIFTHREFFLFVTQL